MSNVIQSVMSDQKYTNAQISTVNMTTYDLIILWHNPPRRG